MSFVDPGRAKEELGFRPTPWKRWLAETARWYAERGEAARRISGA